MTDEIKKTEQPSTDDVLAAIQSFNDPAIITNIFRDLGWSYSVEIKETLALARQNANLSIKFKAIKHLRELLREAAETSGYIANVSQTTPNAQGGYTTFSAKRMAGALNPVRKIESTIKETQNDKEETQTEPDRGSDRGESKRPEGSREVQSGIRDGSNPLDSSDPSQTGRADSERDVDSGGTESRDGRETPRPVPGGTINSGGETNTPESRNPCVKTREPTCDQDLFPGISSAEK